MARAKQYHGQSSGKVGGTTRMNRSGPPSTSSAVPKSLNRGRRVTPAVAKPVATSAKKKKEDGGRQARVKCTEAAPPSTSSAAPTTPWNVYGQRRVHKRAAAAQPHMLSIARSPNPRAQGVSRESGKTTPYPKRPKRGRGHPGARAAPRHRPRAWLALLSEREKRRPRAAAFVWYGSSEPRLSLSGSWQQGHSAAYSTPFLIRVVCRGSIGSGP